MKIKYECNSCGDYIDEITLQVIDEEKLGFDKLNSEERAEVIQFDQNLGIINVKAICDKCWQEYNSDEFNANDRNKYLINFIH